MIYNLVIYIYLFGVKVAGLFSAKPAKMVKGHWEVFDILRNKIDKNARYIWFHAASLGEFEQGRPLIERIRKEHPEYKILQTFFSPSGYEVRKNYQGADLVCYLPFDTPRNVRRFVELANPCMVFFIKYEFWQNYLNELHRRGIPTYSVSSIFRPNQIFFRWYGKRYNELVTKFNELAPQLNLFLEAIVGEVPYMFEEIANTVSDVDIKQNVAVPQKESIQKIQALQVYDDVGMRYISKEVEEINNDIMKIFQEIEDIMQEIDRTVDQIKLECDGSEEFRRQFVRLSDAFQYTIGNVESQFSKLMQQDRELMEETERKNNVANS